MKTYYAVTTIYYDNKTVSNITDTCECQEQPDSSFKTYSDRDVYVDWFGSYEDAQKYVDEARKV